MTTASSVAQRRWQMLSIAFCTLFGMAFILNVHPAGDGLWYWYAVALRHGQNLYRDMQVPMQPLFILLTLWTQRLLGVGWLASKTLAATQVLLYCLGIYLVAAFVRWSDLKKALLILAVFGMTITAAYYRFDDYHVTGHCLVVFSIYLLLRLESRVTFRERLPLVLLLGLLSGLGIGNRLNDGGLLFLSVAACLALFTPAKRIVTLLVFAAVASMTLLALIAMTGSNLHDWLDSTLLRAAAIKGGTGNIFIAPFSLPIALSRALRHNPEPWLIRDVLMTIVGLAVAVVLRCTGVLRGRYRAGAIVGSTVLLLLAGATLLAQSPLGKSVMAVAIPLGMLAYALLGCLLARIAYFAATGRLREWNPREALILLPFGQLFSGAMTSGGSVLEAYSPLAMLLLLLPIILPQTVRKCSLETVYLGLLIVIAVGSISTKAYNPFSWHHYSDTTFFMQRQWFRHPVYGPMYIENDQLAFMQTLCSKIPAGAGDADILAMPWPYPNYFCARPPWKNYVQTWYDTTGQSTVDQLLSDLNNPPEWIVYQRGLDTMQSNELAFKGGKPLPHRALDRLLIDNLNSGRWTLPWQQCFQGSNWLVVHTRAPRPGELNEAPLPTDNFVNPCSVTYME